MKQYPSQYQRNTKYDGIKDVLYFGSAITGILSFIAYIAYAIVVN